MKTLPKLLSGIAIVATVTTGLGVAGSSAQYGSQKADRSELRNAIENSDFATFRSLAAERGGDLLTKINEDNFPRFVELHTAVKDKDFETAEEIRDELGLEKRNKGKRRGGRGKHFQFVVENDFATFKAHAEEKGKTDILEIITADNYAKFQELAQAVIDKDRDTAEALREELGLPEKEHGKHKGRGHGKVMQFVVENDYEAFEAKATEDGKTKILETITTDNYGTFQEFAQAVLDKDVEMAKTLKEELGLKGPKRGERPDHDEDHGPHREQEEFGDDEDDDRPGRRGQRGGRSFRR